jgi:hypothetical protein
MEAFSAASSTEGRSRRREVKPMEVMFLDPEFVPVVGSLVAGGLLFLMAFGAMVYGWFSETPTITKEERRPLELKKAA